MDYLIHQNTLFIHTAYLLRTISPLKSHFKPLPTHIENACL